MVRCAVVSGCGRVALYVPVRAVRELAVGASVLGGAVFGTGLPGRAEQLCAGAGRLLGGGGFGFRVEGTAYRDRVCPVRRA